MRTLIFGGTFNPPHIGHIHIARIARQAQDPDRFLIIPTFIPPHKALDAVSPSPEQRLDMCRLAFSDIPGAEVSDIEIRRGGDSYTVDTLRELSATYPTDTFTLLVGSDSFLNFTAWKRFDEILRMASLAVIPRQEGEGERLCAQADRLKREYGARVRVIDVPPVVVCSTRVRQGEVSGDTLSPSVLSYVRENHLYGT